jgi:S-DNA-T family DNA segregation ATPase FtsK/SpoIIIE
LDAAGAEKLIGRGDMIFAPTGSRARRVQGAFVSDAEVANIVDYVKSHNSRVEYDSNVAESINRAADELDKKNRRDAAPVEGGNDAGGISEEDLVLLKKVAGYFVSCGKASISDAQVRFEFGFQKGKRIVLLLERLGIIGPANGPKPREVKITQQEYEEMMMNDEVWTCISD